MRRNLCAIARASSAAAAGRQIISTRDYHGLQQNSVARMGALLRAWRGSEEKYSGALAPPHLNKKCPLLHSEAKPCKPQRFSRCLGIRAARGITAGSPRLPHTAPRCIAILLRIFTSRLFLCCRLQRVNSALPPPPLTARVVLRNAPSLRRLPRYLPLILGMYLFAFDRRLSIHRIASVWRTHHARTHAPRILRSALCLMHTSSYAQSAAAMQAH